MGDDSIPTVADTGDGGQVGGGAHRGLADLLAATALGFACSHVPQAEEQLATLAGGSLGILQDARQQLRTLALDDEHDREVADALLLEAARRLAERSGY